MEMILLPLAAALLIFMMFSSRRRMKKMKQEQEAKARQMVPGAEIMTHSGLYGTIVHFDADDLDSPVELEIAPGVVVKVHSQSIGRVIEPVAEDAEAEAPLDLPADHPDHIDDADEFELRRDQTAEPAIEFGEENTSKDASLTSAPEGTEQDAHTSIDDKKD